MSISFTQVLIWILIAALVGVVGELLAHRRAPRILAHAEGPARAAGRHAEPDLVRTAGATVEAFCPDRLDR